MKTVLLAAALTIAPFAHAADPQLDKVLSQLDTASAKFKSAEANVKREHFERVVRETSADTGSVYVIRKGASPEMGLIIGKQRMHFAGGKLDVFDGASTKHFDAAEKKNQFESYLTLGFGGSGKDLAANWNVTLQGMEKIDGVDTAKLALVAKDPEVRSKFPSITIWVDPTRSVTLKQVFVDSAKNSDTSYYTGLKYNANVNTGAYKLPK